MKGKDSFFFLFLITNIKKAIGKNTAEVCISFATNWNNIGQFEYYNILLKHDDESMILALVVVFIHIK